MRLQLYALCMPAPADGGKARADPSPPPPAPKAVGSSTEEDSDESVRAARAAMEVAWTKEVAGASCQAGGARRRATMGGLESWTW